MSIPIESAQLPVCKVTPKYLYCKIIALIFAIVFACKGVTCCSTYYNNGGHYGDDVAAKVENSRKIEKYITNYTCTNRCQTDLSGF